MAASIPARPSPAPGPASERGRRDAALSELAHHVALGLAFAALGGAALRAASLAAPRGLERAVAAAAIGASAAVLESLVLGLVALGASPVALCLAAGVTWLAARQLLPAPGLPVAEELGDWWGRSELPLRIALGAALGVGLAWAVWLLRYPALGSDTLIYHLPEVVAWVHDGRPGAVEQLYSVFPVGNYPLTNEVLLGWGSAIGRSFVFAALWSPLMMLLLAAAGWLGLRSLRVGRPACALAVGAMCMTPMLTHWQMNGAHTDLPALAWLVSAAALASASRRRPALLAPALLAVGLGVGTKTTVLPLALVALALALWANRGRLRPLARPLWLAAACALAVGGYWYLRNLVDHGSPLWPFTATPWGDPAPLSELNTRFIERPRATFDALRHDDVDPFDGSYLLLATALLAPLVARRREVTAAAGVTALALLTWVTAPFSGVPEQLEGQVETLSSLRYLMPALASGLLCLALATRAGRAARVYAFGALAAVLAVDTWETLDLGFPRVPTVATVLAGAASGALAALALDLAPRPAWLRRPGGAAVALAAAVLGALLVPAASGFVERNDEAFAQASQEIAAPGPVRWFLSEPGFDGDGRSVAFSSVTNGILAGDRLQNRIELIGQRESCRRIVGRLRDGWIVEEPALAGSRLRRCLAGRRPDFRSGAAVVYGGA